MTEKRAFHFGFNQIVPIAGAAVAGTFIYLGLVHYGFWDVQNGPRPGFFPVLVGMGMLVSCVVAFVFSFRDKLASWPVSNWLVPLSVAAVMVSAFLIGLLPSIAVYLLVWLRGYEKFSWKTTLIVFVVTMAIVIGAFVVWLGVPFPRGLIYETLTN